MKHTAFLTEKELLFDVEMYFLCYALYYMENTSLIGPVLAILSIAAYLYLSALLLNEDNARSVADTNASMSAPALERTDPNSVSVGQGLAQEEQELSSVTVSAEGKASPNSLEIVEIGDPVNPDGPIPYSGDEDVVSIGSELDADGPLQEGDYASDVLTIGEFIHPDSEQPQTDTKVLHIGEPTIADYSDDVISFDSTESIFIGLPIRVEENL